MTLTENPGQNSDHSWTYKATVDPDAKPSTTTTPATPQPAQPQPPIIPVKIVSANDTDTKTNQGSGETSSAAPGSTVNPTHIN